MTKSSTPENTAVAAQDRATTARCLDSASNGELMTILRLPESDENTYRLRELGVIEGSQVVVIKSGDPLLILIEGTRLAVDRELARRIEVQSV